MIVDVKGWSHCFEGFYISIVYTYYVTFLTFASSAPKPRDTSASSTKMSAKAQQKNFEAAVCKPCRLNINEKLKRGYNKYKKLDKPKEW